MKIPEIDNNTLEKRYAKLKPLVKNDQGELHWIKRPADLSRCSFTWDPILEKKAKNLVPIKTIQTLHTYGYYGFFKPSVSEVLSQVPEHLLDKAVGFYVEGPETAEDLNKFKKELDEGFHVAFTTFYREANESILHKPISSKFNSILQRISRWYRR